MRVTTEKTNRVGNHKTKGFTLLEMIGVLAVIAILAAVLVPKVFTAINNSRINNAAMSCQSAKTAIADHYTKAGMLAADTTKSPPLVLAVPIAQYDLLLMKEGFMDKPFAVKIGDDIVDATDTRMELIACPAAAAVTATGNADTTGFILDGVGANNEALGTALAEVVITGVQEVDAQALSQIIDGPALSTALGTSDLVGRVKYTSPAAGKTTTVYVYLTHR